MRNLLMTPKQAAAALAEAVGSPHDVTQALETLMALDRSSQYDGLQIGEGRGYGPMAIRLGMQKLLPERQGFLSESIHDQLPPFIVVHYTKGGTGKTTSTVNAAVALAARGLRVLLIDADPQGNATTLLGVDHVDPHLLTLKNVALEDRRVTLQDATIALLNNAVLDLVGANPGLGAFDPLVTGKRNHHVVMDQMIKRNAEFLKRYDIVLVDTNPSTSSLLTYALMWSATTLLMTVSRDAMSLASHTSMEGVLQELADGGRPARDVRVLMNRFSNSAQESWRALNHMLGIYGDAVMRTVVPDSPALARQGLEKKPGGPVVAVERDPNIIASKRLVQFGLELAEHTLWSPKGLNRLKFESPEIDTLNEVRAEENRGNDAEEVTHEAEAEVQEVPMTA